MGEWGVLWLPGVHPVLRLGLSGSGAGNRREDPATHGIVPQPATGALTGLRAVAVAVVVGQRVQVQRDAAGPSRRPRANEMQPHLVTDERNLAAREAQRALRMQRAGGARVRPLEARLFHLALQNR